MIDLFGLGKAASTAILGVLVLGTISGAYFLWEARVERAAIIAAQRDQLREAIKAKDEAIADRNRIAARFSALPVDRLRLCVQRPPTDGCCKPEPAACNP